MTIGDLYRIRDAIAEGLVVRRGMVITDEIIRDRSANITEYLRPIVDDIVTAALIEAARGEVVTGVIDGAQPHAPMDVKAIRRHLFGETAETLEERLAKEEAADLARKLIK